LRPPINEDPQPEDPPADEDPIFQDDLIAETAVERPSSALASAKRDPITILHSATGVRTEDLSYFAAIPEQWMADVTYVEFWLDASSVTMIPLSVPSWLRQSVPCKLLVTPFVTPSRSL